MQQWTAHENACNLQITEFDMLDSAKNNSIALLKTTSRVACQILKHQSSIN